MNNWIYIIGLILCFQKLAAQNPCDNIIEEATDLYNSGRYEDCINMLENALNTCSLSKNKKENAYVLLINSNIEKDSLPAVDKNFRLLLKNNPSLKIKEYTGLDDFSRKFNNYYVYPKLSFGIRPHYTIPKVRVTLSYQVMPGIINDSEFETKKFFNTNFLLEYRAIEKISFFADAGYFSINFNRDLELKDSIWKMTSTEELRYFQLDFGNKFYFLKSQKKINFYLMGGFSNLYLKKSILNIEREKKVVDNLYGNVDKYEEDYEKNFPSKRLRNAYVVSVFGGGGANYRVGNFGIGLDYRAYLSVNTLNDKTYRFKEESLIKNFGYIDSDIRLIKSDFSLIITYLIYKVKKKPIRD